MTVLMDSGGWVRATQGGLLIGSAASLLFWASGRIAGISGIIGGLIFERRAGDTLWRWLFILGLVIGGSLYGSLAPQQNLSSPVPMGSLPMIVGGLLVGFGTRLGSGCTSGHGVCGIARLSHRSIVATLVFMTCGFLTVFVVRHVGR